MLSNIELIFIHIEKCMGTSFRHMLFLYFKNIYKEDEIYIPEFYDTKINVTNKENYYKLDTFPNDFKVLLCHISYRNKIINDLLKFPYTITCVKDPYKRILSHYYYFEKKKFTDKNFHELDSIEIIKVLNNIGNVMTLRLINEDNNKTIDIQEIKNAVNNINCIVICENIEEDLKYLNKILNIKYNKDYKINIENKNCNIKNYEENIEMDLIYLDKYKEYFMNDINVYNYILSIPLEDRIKI